MPKLLTLTDLDPHWQASGRWRVGQPMTLPVGQVYLHHTVTRDTGDPVKDAAAVNDIDMGRFGKISYSWLVHPSTGTWIEGETLHRGAHTINNADESQNGVSFGVGVIGNFQPGVAPQPTSTPDRALEELIADGLRSIVAPHLTAGWRLDPHSHVYATACCGDLLRPRVPMIRSFVETPPTPPPDLGEDTMHLHYVLRVQDAPPHAAVDGKVWLASLSTEPRHVENYAVAEDVAAREGHIILPPPADGAVANTDKVGATRQVWAVKAGDAALFGL